MCVVIIIVCSQFPLLLCKVACMNVRVSLSFLKVCESLCCVRVVLQAAPGPASSSKAHEKAAGGSSASKPAPPSGSKVGV